MKRALSILLAGIFLTLTPNLDESRCRAQLMQSVLVVAAFCIGGYIVLYVWKTNTAQKLRWLVLNDDDLAGHLTPVATNQVFVGPNLTLAFPAFRVYMDSHEPQGFWRITELTVPPTNWVPQSLVYNKGRIIVCP